MVKTISHNIKKHESQTWKISAMFTQGIRRSEEGEGNTAFIHVGGEDKWTQVEHIKVVKVITQMRLPK